MYADATYRLLAMGVAVAHSSRPIYTAAVRFGLRVFSGKAVGKYFGNPLLGSLSGRNSPYLLTRLMSAMSIGGSYLDSEPDCMRIVAS